MAEHLGLRFFALGVLIVCSAILTGAEAAYFSLGRARLKHVAPKDEDEPVGEPKALIERPHELLVTLLVPPFAILFGSLFLNEVLAPQDFIGLALIALGLAAIDGRLLKLLSAGSARQAA